MYFHHACFQKDVAYNKTEYVFNKIVDSFDYISISTFLASECLRIRSDISALAVSPSPARELPSTMAVLL